MSTSLHQAVLEILESHTVTDQHQLLDLLSHKGFNVSQPSLSRVFRSLGITKHLGRYRRAAQSRALSSGSSGKMVVVAVEPNLMIVHTELGMASALAARLDARIAVRDLKNFTKTAFSEVLIGTLAGDDTIVLVFKEGTSLKAVVPEIENFFR